MMVFNLFLVKTLRTSTTTYARYQICFEFQVQSSQIFKVGLKSVPNFSKTDPKQRTIY